jgi:glycosyltransferase involved in cell wall biosynthesis
MRILSGIDMHYEPNCGSILLAQDMYDRFDAGVETRFLVLEPELPTGLPVGWRGLSVQKSWARTAPDKYQRQLNEFVGAEVKDFQPDLLHCQHLCYGMIAALRQAEGIPKIGICHGTDVIEALRSPVFRASFQSNVDAMNHIVFPSHGILRNARQAVTVPFAKATVIPWGLPDRFLQPDRQHAMFASDPFRVLFAGRFDESKGIELLIAAVALLPRNIHLTLMGKGPTEPELRSQIADLGLQDRVRFAPWQSREQLQKTFIQYQLSVLPSREIEAFGLAAVEAQAAGLPCIVSAVSGLPEIVPTSLQPLLTFESGNISELADRIGAFASRAEDWNEIAAECRASADRFRISTTVASLLSLSEGLFNAL